MPDGELGAALGQRPSTNDSEHQVNDHHVICSLAGGRRASFSFVDVRYQPAGPKLTLRHLINIRRQRRLPDRFALPAEGRLKLLHASD